VVIPWHLGMMQERGTVPEGEYVVPLGVADVKREGTDVTVLANSVQLKKALAVAAKLEGEISVEVIDPRTLVPFDMECLLRSLEKTNRLVIVDEDWESGGWAATISARVMEQGFDLLDAPVLRVCTPNIPVPGGYMEEYIIPTVEKIEDAIRKVCA
jgi:pyruvate dehydrogenase E1 component beta subunit